MASEHAFLLSLLLTLGNTHPEYQTRIPNGNRVPHPCVKGQTWLGVGHMYPAGGGSRNVFGVDFEKHGKKWTRELCTADSDGDGKLNGEELGDPDCTWQPGRTPNRTSDITHPGVCEPVTSHKCHGKNNWFKCKPGNFECDAFKDKDLKNVTIRLPPTPVPPVTTTYKCILFRVPDVTRSYHLVAAQPLLNNTQVVHHMLLFGCRDTDKLEESPAPYECDMVPHARCQEVIVTWTIGIQGDCVHKDTGFRLGKHGYKMVALQVHWNNPDKASHFVDSSGIIVHLTPNLRQHDAGILIFGHIYLQVDPLPSNLYEENHDNDDDGDAKEVGFMRRKSMLQTYTSVCPQHCMAAMLPSTIYITTAINHMHYLGNSQKMELLRNKTDVVNLAVDETFDYDSPVIHRHDPPVVLRPGDEIRTTCTFRRPSKGSPVCYGDGTSDEMCFGFLTYFPLQKELLQPWCTSRRSLISCERTLPQFWDRPIQDCAWRAFIRPPSQEAKDIVADVIISCIKDGQPACSKDCQKTLQKVRKHPCFIGDVGYYTVGKIRETLSNGMLFGSAWYTCNCDQKFDYCERVPDVGKQEQTLENRACEWNATSRATIQCSFGLVQFMFSLLGWTRVVLMS